VKKPGIPPTPLVMGEMGQFLDALKTHLEMLGGVRGGVIEPLATDATLVDVITKVNQLVDRINAR